MQPIHCKFIQGSRNTDTHLPSVLHQIHKMNRVQQSKIVLLIIGALCQLSQQAAPIVEVATGKLKGEDKESRLDRQFYAYRGIPYAKPPIGDLQFEPPQKADNWTGIRDAKEYGDKCIQYSAFEKKVVGAENCLFINVFTPKIGDGLSKKLLPIMVFIHGGGFMHGTADVYRPHYFMDEDVVIVTFNYRLGSFGFLSTGDAIVPGNMGLRDQILALEWVRDNIRKFSGDPLKVTIFGEDAGSISVHLLLLSPLSNGLFRKAISQSGNALAVSALQTRPRQAAQRLGRILNCGKILTEAKSVNDTDLVTESDCSWEDSKALIKCLKLVDAKKIAEVHKEAFQLLRNPLSNFAPVVEVNSGNGTPVLPEHPYSILISGRQKRIPWITGFNAQEGLVYTGVIMNDQNMMGNVESNWNQLSANLLNYDGSRTDVTSQIKTFYLQSKLNPNPIQNGQNNSIGNVTTTQAPAQVQSNSVAEGESIVFEEKLTQFTSLFTDRFYATPMFESVKIQASYSPVYLYNYAYEGQHTMLDVITGKTKEPTPTLKRVTSWVRRKVLGRAVEIPKHLGVCNGDELLLLFKYPELKIKDDAQDFAMSKDLVRLWVQFAQDEGNVVFRNSSWSPINTQDETGVFQVMKFGNSANDTGLVSMANVYQPRVNFWNSLKYVAPFEQ